MIRPTILTRLYAGRVFVVLPALLLASGPSDATAQERGGPMQSAASGSQLFQSKGCGACHSADTSMFRSSARDGARTFYDLAAGLWNHLPGMASRLRASGRASLRLDAAEAEALVAYLYTLNYFDPPGDPNRGATLFRERNCQHCHQVRRAGGIAGPDLDFLGLGSPIHLAAALWNHAGTMRQKADEIGERVPHLTGDELNDIIAYVRSASPQGGSAGGFALPGRSDVGRDVFESVGCARCHGDGGRGPSLAGPSRGLSRLDFAAHMWNAADAMIRAADAAGIDLQPIRASQMADLIAYLYTQGYMRPGGDRAAGGALLSSKGCLNCHSVRGQGGANAVDLTRAAGLESPAGVLAAMWNHVMVGSEGSEEPGPWPVLSPVETADLVAFLQSLR